MSQQLILLTNQDQPQIDGPTPDRLIAGAPVFSTWPGPDQDGLFCGRWQSTPGKWRAIYTEWEYCHILSGISVLTADGQPPKTLRSGDSFIIPRGFAGTWEVIETTLKDYVIRP